MNTTKNSSSQQSRFLKLSLKKNKLKNDENCKKLNLNSDVIVLDESLDKMNFEIPKRLHIKPVVYSPIVINDSSEHSDEESKIHVNEKEPSRYGNVSFNNSVDQLQINDQPSIGGWSPAQNILTATPRDDPIPSTPKDKMNESYEQCSIKKIQQSQKKILNDLYGDTWKSIPKLLKTITHKYENFDGITKKLFDTEGDKENIRQDLKKNKELYLTSSDVKRNEVNYGDTEKKSKKKLYTEKVPNTPDVKIRDRNVNSTTKKVKIKKGMSVTELVQAMKTDDILTNKSDKILTNKIDNILTNKTDNVDVPKKGKTAKKAEKIDELMKRIENVTVTPSIEVKRLSFMGSLADNVPSWRCHPEAIQYIDNYKTMREELTARLYKEFNKCVFDNGLDADMIIMWDGKLRSTAGTTRNRLIKTSAGARLRSSSIKLSTKVVDGPERLRDTLVHEMCHAATWVIDDELRAGHGPLWKKCIKQSTKVVDGQEMLRDTLIHEMCHAATWVIDDELRAGHGPLWKKWTVRALRVYPELGEIARCHDLQIHFKYSYKCTQCGYSIQRHSKSIDVTKKCCGYCHGTFALVLNKKNKDGVVVTTPARKGPTNGFAQYVKENYATVKNGVKTHAQVMKLLGEQFSAKKSKPADKI